MPLMLQRPPRQSGAPRHAALPHSPRRRHLLRTPLLAGLLGAAFIAGCATTPPSPPPVAHNPAEPLHLTGRFSFTSTSNLPQSRPQHSSGRFQLDREGENLSIELSSPFGQTLVRAAQRQSEAAWLETAQHQRYTGPTLEAVLQDAIGIPVPVSRLPDWLTDRFQNVEERSADGHSIRARDAGWQLERNDSRWFLTWHQNPQRIEILLVVDPTAQPAEQP